MYTPTSIEEVQQAIHASDRVQVVGGKTKSALSDGAKLSTAGLHGILQYEPSEYTFTALAGTPIRDIYQMLNKQRQFMPFDPPLMEAGATLGGTVAAGLSGPGRFRYGGVRDFILGVKMITGEGRVVFGGGKVVKNAAGFDIPKLVVGSLGRMGVLVELTFKVFPSPESYVTLCIERPDMKIGHQLLVQLLKSQLELTCLDLEPPGRLWIRIGGIADALEDRVQRLQQFVHDSSAPFYGEEDARVWQSAREFGWLPNGHRLVKIPITPAQIKDAEEWFDSQSMTLTHRYSVGGNVVWVGWPDELKSTTLEQLCLHLRRPALVLTGKWEKKIFGRSEPDAFEQRLRSVFDPQEKLQG